MEKKQKYFESPEIIVTETVAENGFAASQEETGFIVPDYENGIDF